MNISTLPGTHPTGLILLPGTHTQHSTFPYQAPTPDNPTIPCHSKILSFFYYSTIVNGKLYGMACNFKFCCQSCFQKMAQKGRSVSAHGIYQHIYQRSSDRSRIFRSSIDAIYFISVFHRYSLLYDVDTLAFCLMGNHLHMLSRATDASRLYDFIRDYSSVFARGYNAYYNLNGHLFQRPFGSALKAGSKRLRTCISYINNNPVEAGIERSMEDYVWNLFAYGQNSHPFSEKLVLRKSSKALRNSVAEVAEMIGENKILPQVFLANIFRKLEKEEQKQLRDYILKRYSPINYRQLESIFGSYDEAKHAMHSFIGREYDLKCE